MARVIADDMPPHPRFKYDWDRWFDGQVWELRQGSDFEPDSVTFRSMAHNAAKQRRLRIICRTIPLGLLIQKVGDRP